MSACTGRPPTKAAHCGTARFSVSLGGSRRVTCLKRQLRAQRGNRPLHLQRNLTRGLHHQRLGRCERGVQRVKDDDAERQSLAGARLGLRNRRLLSARHKPTSGGATRLHYQVGAETAQRHCTLLHRRRLRKASLVQAAHELGLAERTVSAPRGEQPKQHAPAGAGPQTRPQFPARQRSHAAAGRRRRTTPPASSGHAQNPVERARHCKRCHVSSRFLAAAHPLPLRVSYLCDADNT